MVHVIDTDLVSLEKRAQYLDDAVAESPLPLIRFAEASFRQSRFHARFSGRMVGSAFITRFSANDLQLRRTSKEIDQRSCGMILLALLHRGRYDQQFGYEASFPEAGPGDFALMDLDAPQSVTFTQSALTTCAYIPRGYFVPFTGDISFLRPTLFTPRDHLYGMLVACFREFVAMRKPSAAEASGALSVLSHIALIAGGLHPETHGDLKASLVDARRIQAQQFIAQHCDDARLNARAIAAHLGISTRSLHAAFEETGYGIAARTLSARLAKARDMLLTHPDHTALDIALACGFNNLSTFYRGFCESYGMPPGEFRKSRHN